MPQAQDEAGNIWETDAQGNAVRLIRAANAAPQMPADPTFPYQGAQAQAQAANTGAQAQVNQATVPAQITSANADATAKTRTAQTAGLPEGFMWGPDGRTAVPIPGYSRQGLSPEIRSQAIQTFADADALERAADEIERLYKTGPGATSGLAGIQDYLPTSANKVFNDAGQQARGYVKRALGFTGGEGNTAAESSALYDPYLPSASDRDEQIVAKIGKLRALANDARQKAVTTLGGVPDAAGNINPMPSAFEVPRIVNGSGPTAAGFGATEGGQPVPPGYQQAYEAFVRTGNFTPDQYAAFRAQLDQQFFGEAAPQVETYREEGARILETLQKGGDLNLTVPPTAEPLSGIDQFRNNLIANPAGAALAGALDMGGFGGVSALAPDQMAALGDEHPAAMAIGQIGGAITGTGALGKLSKETIGRAAPSLLRGGGKGLFARNLATDAAYSGIYGGVTGDNPLASAGLGAVGSGLGQGLGKGLGAAIGGARVSPAAEALRARGISMTVPQQLGGFVKSIEDKATSIPLVGDMIAARRMEGLEGFNREAMREAGAPIGFAPSEIGKGGIDQLVDAVGNAYDQSTAGVSVPFDPQFTTDMGAFGNAAQQLPRDLRVRAARAVENRVAPLTDTGQMTGEQFQQAVRGLKGYKAEVSKPGFEQDYRDALTLAQDALTEQMRRGGGQSVVEGLDRANAAYRNIRTVEDAVTRADGAGYVATPSQLQDALKKTQRRFPGQTPLSDLADNGQLVLPNSVPNSGTADRAAQMVAAGSLIGAGTGAGAYFGGDAAGAGTGAGTSAAATALLLLGGTKAGQKVLQKAIIDRPATAQILGNTMKRRMGLFGSASLPFVITE